MKFLAAALAASLILGSSVAFAQNGPANVDDNKGLSRGADGSSVTVSGVSSGAAMAVQFAVAHSASVAGVGAIAGPGWGCADGKFSTAVDACMCGRQEVDSRFSDAIKLAYDSAGLIDPMDPQTGKPKALRHSYVFQSAEDKTVVAESGRATIRFLRDFTGNRPAEDWGNAKDGSKRAGHGILAKSGTDSCPYDGREKSYIRKCGSHDNAGRLFRELYGELSSARKRERVPRTVSEVWEFSQQPLIKEIRDSWPKPIVASDMYYPTVHHSDERLDFDLAPTGYLYVPANCRSGGKQCRVHIALHGCKQDPKTFAKLAGYNYWAEKYDVIVVYPAVKSHRPAELNEGQICRISKDWSGNDWKLMDGSWTEANYNGCWDWWGYLDTGDSNLEGSRTRYLTKDGPQIRFIKKIVDAVTKPL